MLRRISQRFKVAVENYLPNAFIFAILLTFITLILGITVTHQSLTEMTTHWYGGFWNFLAFTMQMILILITGYALVKAPPIQRILIKAASIPKTQKSALILTIVVAAAAGYLSWGLGLVLGSLFAIEVAKNVKTADFRILIAAAYTGTIAILPASITITAPLLVNTPGHSLESSIGLIPLSETIFSPTLLLTAFIGLAVVLFAYIKMMPKQDEVIPFEGDVEVFTNTVHSPSKTVAEKLDHSKIITYTLVALGVTWLVQYVLINGFNLELNILNFFFIILGLALHGTPISYINAITEGMPSASGILIQFPFYAGIMGMMVGSGLISVISEAFVSISNEYTFPFLSFLSAAIVNVFVPSAGGQWQIQGPIMIEAARALNVPIATAINTVTIGDVVTNLLQPFFVLPALGLSGLGLKDIWGYCMVSMVLLMIVAGVIVTVLPLII
ncbi:short-chain fatty acid transporter [Sporosarcina sp. E16_3]|uniref:short-chain fatty acid transporter n=1 Tax=Sporosarcina sp. E16_3 TaxID=2789293 RepID=UPI001A92EB56|nr:TIGR00366 family protein [Sporosarcina sp. E16_3]MBO0603456.1 short-chain fatty acid transporter [Sporosarcina sp. E16_3]